MREGAIRRVAAIMRLQNGVRARDWMQYSCPFAPWKHRTGKDSKPSFGIRINDRGGSHYYCFTCHSAGQVSYLPVDLATTAGRPTDRANHTMLKIMAIETDEGFGLFEDTGVHDEPPEPLSEKAYGDIFPPVYDDEAAYAYVRRRGVSDYAIDTLDIRYDPDDSRIVFPVRDRAGQLFGYTGRTILPPDEWPHPHYFKSKDYLGLPKRQMLLGVQCVRDDNRGVVTVEGPIDLAVTVSHLERVRFGAVALLGSDLSPDQADMLIDLGLPVYCLLDCDEAGELGIYGNGKRKGMIDKLFSEVPVYVPAYPDRKGADDPGTLKRGELLRALREAEAEK